MANVLNQLNENLYHYFQDMTVCETPVMQQCRRETAKLPNGYMQISPEQAQFMQFLCRVIGARRVLEVGTFTGYSALAMAEALPADGKIICCDVNKEWTDMAQRCWQQAGVAHKIDLHVAPAADTLQQLLAQGQANSFDFIFIDADKAGYPEYYELAYQLLNKRGVIAVDNIFRHGDIINPDINSKSMRGSRELNDMLKQDERIHLSVVPIGDGLALIKPRHAAAI